MKRNLTERQKGLGRDYPRMLLRLISRRGEGNEKISTHYQVKLDRKEKSSCVGDRVRGSNGKTPIAILSKAERDAQTKNMFSKRGSAIRKG